MNERQILSPRKRNLIDQRRIDEIGGLANPDILRILDSFTNDLTGYMHLIDQQREKKLNVELSMTLHKLSGASRNCGFAGIGEAVEALLASENRFGAKLHANLRSVIAGSIEEWRGLVS